MKAKTKLKLAQKFALIDFSFWIVETVVFLVIYGWHWNAINEVEEVCDRIASITCMVSFYYFFSIMYDIAKFYIKIESVKIEKNDKPDIQLL